MSAVHWQSEWLTFSECHGLCVFSEWPPLFSTPPCYQLSLTIRSRGGQEEERWEGVQGSEKQKRGEDIRGVQYRAGQSRDEKRSDGVNWNDSSITPHPLAETRRMCCLFPATALTINHLLLNWFAAENKSPSSITVFLDKIRRKSFLFIEQRSPAVRLNKPLPMFSSQQLCENSEQDQQH